MSKTKEEILRPLMSLPIQTVPNVCKAMDEYASQVLSEYKEKLKGEIRYVRSKSNFELSGGVIIQIIDRL